MASTRRAQKQKCHPSASFPLSSFLFHTHHVPLGPDVSWLSLALRPMLQLGHEGHILSPSRMKLDFLWRVLRGPALGVIVVFWDLTKEQRSSGLFVANLPRP